MAKQQVAKVAHILGRIEQQNAPQACYKVRASEPLEIGEETEYPVYYHEGRRYATYTVIFVNCVLQSCDCSSYGRKNCYHGKQCQVVETKRYEERRAILFARYLALAIVTEQIAAINAKYAKVATTVQPEVQASLASIENRGTLNKQRPGWLQLLPSRKVG